ncbi:hypothetical protein [Rubritalea tangerina]|uniref:hypothetical protein n=1 Tax=Rubritalea tangerina TaxID=430798 RepID=UPI00361D79A3
MYFSHARGQFNLKSQTSTLFCDSKVSRYRANDFEKFVLYDYVGWGRGGGRHGEVEYDVGGSSRG